MRPDPVDSSAALRTAVGREQQPCDRYLDTHAGVEGPRRLDGLAAGGMQRLEVTAPVTGDGIDLMRLSDAPRRS